MRVVAMLLIATWSSSLTAADWGQFRGPSGQGYSDAKNLPVTFSEQRHVQWKTPVPGEGWSSPVVDGSHIWLTTAMVTKASEEDAAAKLATIKNSRGLEVASQVELKAICFNRESGELLHTASLMTIRDPEPIHSLNSFASPTPVLQNGRLFCHFGTYGTVCMDTKSRKVLWKNKDLKLDHQNGPGSSPIVWEDKLIVHCDGRDVQYVAALDVGSGELAWKTDRSGTLPERDDFRKAYCTPLVVNTADGRTQLISPAADWVYSYDPATGKELWKANYGRLGFSNVARPVCRDGMVYICTCFMQSEVLAIRCDGTGDVTKSHIVWRYDKQAPRMPSPILAEDLFFMVSDNGIATCLDAKTGKLQWRERLGGNFSASPVVADGRLYFFNREGDVFAIQPARTFQLLGKSHLDGEFMASAVPLEQAIYLRTDSHMYRVQAD